MASQVVLALRAGDAADQAAFCLAFHELMVEPPFPLPQMEMQGAAGPVSERLVAFMSQINEAVIVAASGHLIVHAGAASLPSGHAVVVCGPSGSGKTTLTLGLIASGLSYQTDEAVIVEPRSLRLLPYRKPAVVKVGAQPLFPGLRPPYLEGVDGTWLVPPGAFDQSVSPSRPIAPRLLVFPRYQPGSPPELERLSEAKAAFLLGSETFRLSEVSGGALPALARLVRRAPAFTLTYGRLDDAVVAVRDLLAAA